MFNIFTILKIWGVFGDCEAQKIKKKLKTKKIAHDFIWHHSAIFNDRLYYDY